MKPELAQRREYDGEISSTVRGKESGYVLNEEPSSGLQNCIGNAGEIEEEGGSLSGESGSSSGMREVLAGEPPGEEVNRNGACVIPPS